MLRDALVEDVYLLAIPHLCSKLPKATLTLGHSQLIYQILCIYVLLGPCYLGKSKILKTCQAEEP